MNYKVIIVVVIAVGIVAVGVSMSNIIKPQEPQNVNQSFTKSSVSPSMQNFTLPENYTSIQLLDYCSQNESQIYNDVCIRGLWSVSDACKSGNFSSTNSVCTDTRLVQFEDKVTKEMHDLNNSLENFVTSCMNVTSDNDIGNCYSNMERIKNDCTDAKFVSMMPICSDSKIDQFDEKYKDILSRLNS